jgi:hypothetical protein
LNELPKLILAGVAVALPLAPAIAQDGTSDERVVELFEAPTFSGEPPAPISRVASRAEINVS